MEFNIVAMSQEAAKEIATWHYPEPYTIYSLSSHVIPTLLNLKNGYFAIVGKSESLIGYCCFGAEARVLGGDYSVQDESVLDVGVGMCPSKTGEGLGKFFVSAVLRFARKLYKPARFRVTIAKFNKRSLRTFESLGFKETFRFRRPGDQLTFIQLEWTSIHDT